LTVPDGRMTTILIYLPQPLKAQLDAARHALGVTNSVIIRTLLRDWPPDLQTGEYPSVKPQPTTTHKPNPVGTALEQNAEAGVTGQYGSTGLPCGGQMLHPGHFHTPAHRSASPWVLRENAGRAQGCAKFRGGLTIIGVKKPASITLLSAGKEKPEAKRPSGI
jgi:hypothetical protein